MATAEDWQNELRRWLGPFLNHLGHKARRRMCPLYVAGLIGPGERKSVQPMASRTPAADYDQLHHFVGAGIWDEAPLERELISDRVFAAGPKRRPSARRGKAAALQSSALRG